MCRSVQISAVPRRPDGPLTGPLAGPLTAPLAGGQMSVPAMTFEVISDADRFADLEGDWRVLARRAPDGHFFQGFDWLWRTWQCVAAPRERALRLLVGRCNGRVELIWPLMIDGRHLRLLSSDQFEYRDVLVGAGDKNGIAARTWLRAAWREVLRLPGVDVAVFEDIRPGSRLAELFAERGASGWRIDIPVRTIRLERYAGWDAFAATRSAKLMRDQRRQWRRLKDAGAKPRFEIVSDPADIAPTLDWLLARKHDWLAAEGLDAPLFASAEYRALLHAAAADTLASGHVLLARLVAGEAPMSAVLGYRYKDEFTFQMFAYDPAWQSYSPSRLAMECLIRWCFDQGVRVFDFMPGDQAFKDVWGDQVTTVSNYLVPLSRSGRLWARWYASEAVEHLEKSWIIGAGRRLPLRWRRLIRQTLWRYRPHAGHWRRLA